MASLPAGGGPGILMRHELAQPMMDLHIRPFPGSESMLASLDFDPSPLPGMQVQRWNLTATDVTDFVQEQLHDSTVERRIVYDFDEKDAYSNSISNGRFLQGGLDRINDINGERGVRRHWYWQSTKRGTRSEFIYKDVDNGTQYVPAEGKYFLVFPTSSLLNSWQNSECEHHSAAKSILTQMARFMINTGAMYGAFTTFIYTFAMRRKHADSLEFEITDGYLNKCTSPSVPEVMFYLSEMEVIHRQAQAIAAAPEGPLPMPASRKRNSRRRVRRGSTSGNSLRCVMPNKTRKSRRRRNMPVS